MYKKGDVMYLKFIDDKFHKVTILRKNKKSYDIKFEDGRSEKCHEKFLLCHKPEKTVNKHKKYIRRCDDTIVNFGKYKNKSITYKEILKQNMEYCKAIVKGFYTVPPEFKTYCCDHLID